MVGWLSESFVVFGIQLQNWMLIIAAIVIIAILLQLCRK
jgi:hypothetical protein